jgi:hypothetical protein
MKTLASYGFPLLSDGDTLIYSDWMIVSDDVNAYMYLNYEDAMNFIYVFS